MSLNTVPVPLLLSHLRALAERMAAFGSQPSPGPEPHPDLHPEYQRLATPQKKAAWERAWAARAWGRFAQDQANLLADFTSVCKDLGCADPAGLLAGRGAEDFGAGSVAVKREVVEFFRLAAAGQADALIAKMSKLSGPAAASVRLASPILSAEAERLGRSTPQHAPPAGAAGRFQELQRKQRTLLLALDGKGKVPREAVWRAVYGAELPPGGSFDRLDKLVYRTNGRLTHENYRLEIKRKANTYTLQSI
jgi:hypothetical protein